MNFTVHHVGLKTRREKELERTLYAAAKVTDKITSLKTQVGKVLLAENRVADDKSVKYGYLEEAPNKLGIYEKRNGKFGRKVMELRHG